MENYLLLPVCRSPNVFGVLLQLLRESSNYKIRIQAAAALAVPVSVHGKMPSYHEFPLVVYYNDFAFS